MISVEALLIYGCIFCLGFYSEKASVFARCIAPDSNSVITITDKDLKVALRFLFISATILEEMQLDLMMNPKEKPDHAKIQWKIAKYEPTILGMLEDFEDTVFGYFYNRRSLECF